MVEAEEATEVEASVATRVVVVTEEVATGVAREEVVATVAVGALEEVTAAMVAACSTSYRRHLLPKAPARANALRVASSKTYFCLANGFRPHAGADPSTHPAQ